MPVAVGIKMRREKDCPSISQQLQTIEDVQHLLCLPVQKISYQDDQIQEEKFRKASQNEAREAAER